MMRCGVMVLMRSGSVMMLWMIVIGVDMRVQRRTLAGGRHHGHPEQDRNQASHNRSVCNHGGMVK
jgi:hypothetical protein